MPRPLRSSTVCCGCRFRSCSWALRGRGLRTGFQPVDGTAHTSPAAARAKPPRLRAPDPRHALGRPCPARAVGRAIEQTAGNALYLEEMIRALAANRSDDRPETILAMMQARIGWLDPSLRRIIRAAAIYGMTFWSGARPAC